MTIPLILGGKGEYLMAYEHCCNMMKLQLEDSRPAIRFLNFAREYRLLAFECSPRFPQKLVPRSPIHFGETIKYCPWCGTELPKSLFQEWWRRAMQFGPEGSADPYDTDMPPMFFTSEWWDT